jgi:hypothetical protein
VSSFAYARPQLGGDGVTEIELGGDRAGN